MTSHVELVGIEVEGGWTRERSPRNPVHDGSVKLGFLENIHYAGESVSPPLEVEHIKSWIDSNYPDFINDTCGVHVHISAKSTEDYIRLMSSEFEAFFHKFMTDFGTRMGYKSDHPFWDRLSGSNPYCARDHRPEEQVVRTDKRGPRYSQLNYCFGLHGTLECRLFHGSNNPDEIYKCVMSFIDCVTIFLTNTSIEVKSLDMTFEITEEELKTIKVPKLKSRKSNPSLSWEYAATTATTAWYDLAEPELVNN